jgi:hypothetical protein
MFGDGCQASIPDFSQICFFSVFPEAFRYLVFRDHGVYLSETDLI